jgi:hypothetical protein
VIIPKGRGMREIIAQSTELKKKIRRRHRKYEKQR